MSTMLFANIGWLKNGYSMLLLTLSIAKYISHVIGLIN